MQNMKLVFNNVNRDILIIFISPITVVQIKPNNQNKIQISLLN